MIRCHGSRPFLWFISSQRRLLSGLFPAFTVAPALPTGHEVTPDDRRVARKSVPNHQPGPRPKATDGAAGEAPAAES